MKVSYSIPMLILALLLGTASLAGCSYLQQAVEVASENKAVTEAVVKNRTLSFIDADPDVAGALQGQAQDVLALLEDDQPLTLDRLEEVADKAIPWGALGPEREKRLRRAIAVIQEGLDQYSESDERLSAEQELYLSTVLTWMIEASRTVP